MIKEVSKEIIDDLDLFDLIIEYEEIALESKINNRSNTLTKLMVLLSKVDNLLVLAGELKDNVSMVFEKYSK